MNELQRRELLKLAERLETARQIRDITEMRQQIELVKKALINAAVKGRS